MSAMLPQRGYQSRIVRTRGALYKQDTPLACGQLPIPFISRLIRLAFGRPVVSLEGMEYKKIRCGFGQDEWGGETLRERARFTMEVVEGIREELALRAKEDFIIGARISEPDMVNLRDIVEVLDGDLGMDFLSGSNPDVFNADAISTMTQFVKMMKPKAAVMQATFTSYLATQVNPVEQMRYAATSTFSHYRHAKQPWVVREPMVGRSKGLAA